MKRSVTEPARARGDSRARKSASPRQGLRKEEPTQKPQRINDGERETTSDAAPYIQNVKQELDDLVDRLRDDLRVIDEPKAQALFETAAEVLLGLKTALSHYEENREPGMRRNA